MSLFSFSFLSTLPFFFLLFLLSVEGWRPEEEGDHEVGPRWTPVSCRQNWEVSQEVEVRLTSRHWHPHLPRRRPQVPRHRGDGVGRECCKGNKKNRIIPRHVLLTIKNDEELGNLLAGVTIAHGGMLPNINLVLLPKKTQKAVEEEKSPAKGAKSPKKA